MSTQFIADVHLGRLARLLRMLGFDTLYDAQYTRPQLLKLAVTQSRVLLTRAAALAANPFVHTFIVTSEDAETQLQQVVVHFGLQGSFHPFSRCIVCNTPLQPVDKNEILLQLEPNTAAHFNEFWQCPHCHRIYWKGSHYERMQQRIAQWNNARNK